MATAIVMLPAIASEVVAFKAGLILIFLVAALGLHVLVNWAGELSLAHAGLVGLPAFAVLGISEIGGVSPIYLLPVGMLVGAAAGIGLGLPTLRARGLQVALVTLAAGIAIDRFFFNQSWLVGPTQGRQAAAPRLGPLLLESSRALYPLLAGITVVVAAAIWALLHSRAARAWFWVRSDPAAAAVFGIRVVAYRLAAYATGGCLAGLAGALTVMWVQRLTAETFPTTLSFTYLIAVVLAGPGFIGGLAFAAAGLEGVRLFFTGFGPVLTYLGGFGLVINITWYPQGLNGAGRKAFEEVRARLARVRRSSEAPEAALLSPDPTSLDSVGHPIQARRSEDRSVTGELLSVADISVAFGGVQALSGVSLRVPEGSVVGLIGPNGAGKTTLFNVISGLQPPDAGTVFFAGKDVTGLRADQRARRGIGRSFQNLGLVGDETILTNLLAAQHLAMRYASWDAVVRPWRWWQEEKRMNARATGAAAEFGLERELERRVADLSFATARFTELACLVVERPRLMLLDEPTTGLDLRGLEQLHAVLRRQRDQGVTILVVAHDVRFVMQICDHVYVLSEGRLLADGPPAVIQRDPAVAEAYLGVTA